jgi:polar amino acid transport system substrate-binding protein
MRGRRRRLISSIAGVLATLGVAATAQAKEWRELRIASEGARPPYNYLDANNELMGFEIDLGRELCRRMSVSCSFLALDWDSLIPSLTGGKVDAIMAAMEITDERLQTIDFTRPYVKMPNAFVVASDSDLATASVEALKGKSIGVEADGPHQSFLESIYPQSEIKSYASLEEAILDLAEHRVDAVFGAKDAVMDFMTNRREAKCCRVLADAPRDPAFFGEGVGVGVRQSDPDLKAMFNKALGGAFADGSFERIRAKYFDFSIR